MGSIRSFTELECWQLSETLTAEIYQITSLEPISMDFGFKDQIRRASISIMNNIAKGFGRFNSKEFQRFLNYSLGSCTEIMSMLYVAKRLKYIPIELFQDLLEQCKKLRAKLLHLRRSQM